MSSILVVALMTSMVMSMMNHNDTMIKTLNTWGFKRPLSTKVVMSYDDHEEPGKVKMKDTENGPGDPKHKKKNMSEMYFYKDY